MPRRVSLACRTLTRRRKEPPPEAPIRIGTRRLWLLAGPDQYRLATWHIGEGEALCGKRAREAVAPLPRALSAGHAVHTTCLTTVAGADGVDVRSLPIALVCMLRQSRRGASTAVIRSGWYLGDGRRTLCDKRGGPWALTERRPNARMCFVCGERERWEDERKPGVVVSSGLGARSVLLDAGVDDGSLEALLGQARGLYAGRRARTHRADRRRGLGQGIAGAVR